jgi:F-type H+-transporting ATPase subunit alpha
VTDDGLHEARGPADRRAHAGDLRDLLKETFGALREVREGHSPRLRATEVGTVLRVGKGVASVRGLPAVRSEELVELEGGHLALALNLDPDEVALVLLDEGAGIEAGAEARRTGRVLDVPVGEGLLGRVVDATGRSLDGGGPIKSSERRPIERRAPAIMERSPVTVPLQTGLMIVDSVIPVGRGQRELILGDRQTGKTAIAVDTIINQRDTDVVCVYCAIGQRSSAVARVVTDVRQHGDFSKVVVVVASGEDPPGLKYITPYAATSMAEFFMERGGDVLIVYDDLTRHARAYRELSLLLRRPPAREAYPGDIFYVHSRLLERATHLSEDLGGGSLTALPIVETQAQNISAYIPTNLISITDGQIYLSPERHRQGYLPAVDIGDSVSRVGGKTQLPAFRNVAGDLRLAHSQFEELESFARFGAELDEETREKLERGRRVRESLKQSQFAPVPVPEQIAVLSAVTVGLFDGLDLDEIGGAKERVRRAAREELTEISEKIARGEELSEGERSRFIDALRDAVEQESEQ